MNMQNSREEGFRPIQYLGNKTRLLDEIAAAMEPVVDPSGTVVDLFSGTSVVARRLAARNRVIAVDVQTYAEVLGRAMLQARFSDMVDFDLLRFTARADEAVNSLERVFAPLIAQEKEALAALHAGDVRPITQVIEGGAPLSKAASTGDCALPEGVRTLITKEPIGLNDATATLAFGGVYFSFTQSIQLDALYQASVVEIGPRRDVLIAIILGVASEVVNTVGKQFAQPIRLLDRNGEPKPLLMQRTRRDRGLDVRTLFRLLLERWCSALKADGFQHQVVRAEVADFLKSDRKWDAAYADPPYTIDHYSRFYHVLETLVRRDRPPLSRMRKGGVWTIMRGLYREDRFQSDFCVPSRAPDAFRQLFEGVAARGAPLVLSYSGHIDPKAQRSRTLPIDAIAKLARCSYRHVDITEPRFEGHRKLNVSHRNAATEHGSERLIVCRI